MAQRLEKNHNKRKEIWLFYYKKHAGKKRIPYKDAVKEAICYDWIDSIIKKIDEEKFMQKFTPRKEKSNWSDINKDRARRMINADKMTKAGYEKLEGIDLNIKSNMRIKKQRI